MTGRLCLTRYIMKNGYICLAFFVSCIAPHFAFAANLATDNAADAAYNNGWQSGSNGGSGWGSAWTLTPSGVGAVFFVGNSASNGNGDTSLPTGDINTPQQSSGRAWGLAAGIGFTADAIRQFDGSLSVGQTFSIDFDSGTLASGAAAGLRLENASGNMLWEFRYQGGFAPYTITDASGSGFKSATVTDEGVHIEFTLTSTASYSAAVTPLGSSTPVTRSAGLISAIGGTGVSQVHLFFAGNAAISNSNKQYFNNASVVPEPSSVGLLVGGFLVLAMRKGITPRKVYNAGDR